jgi:predicted Zn finger-like uncharacterized protein
MAVRASCPACGAKFRADEKFAGRKVKCPKCSTPMTLPAAEPDPAELEVPSDLDTAAKPETPADEMPAQAPAATADQSPATEAAAETTATDKPPAEKPATVAAKSRKKSSAALEKAPAEKAAAPTPPADDGGEIGRAPEGAFTPQESPEPAAATPESPANAEEAPADLDALSALAAAPAKSGTRIKPVKRPAGKKGDVSEKCPGCGASLGLAEKICVECGYSRKTRRPVGERGEQGGDKADARRAAARKMIFIGSGAGALVLLVMMILLFRSGGGKPASKTGTDTTVAKTGPTPVEPVRTPTGGATDAPTLPSATPPAGSEVPDGLVVLPSDPPAKAEPKTDEPQPKRAPTGVLEVLPSRPRVDSKASRRDGPTESVPTPPPPSTGVQTDLSGWLQDFEQAKAQAASQNKDVLVLFQGSDWCGWCIRLNYEVFFQAEFRNQAERDYVLVQVDFPRRPDARNKVQNADRNRRLRDRFGVQGYPQVLVTDARGLPYAKDGYVEGGVPAFMSRLAGHRRVKDERDRMLSDIASRTGVDKLRRARDALRFLYDNDLENFYGPLYREWTQYARMLDPRNDAGHVEVFFEADWMAEYMLADTENPAELPREIGRLTGPLEAFRREFRFKDPDRAVKILLITADLLMRLNRRDEAMSHIKEASAYSPRDGMLARRLELYAGAIKGRGAGTGWVAAEGGFIMTNYHVIEGTGKVLVRIPGMADPAPTIVVAQDEKRDMALLRVPPEAAAKLAEAKCLPLRVEGKRSVGRGEAVAALGYPLGETLGTGIKLTTGHVSALPEKGNREMVMIDAKINPGNSGGPLCDALGNVVGMITARYGGGGLDSYGMALPGADLDAFLRRHCTGYPARVFARGDGGAPPTFEPVTKAQPKAGPVVKPKNPDADRPLEYWIDRLRRGSNAETRRSAAATLGKLGAAAKDALPALTEALKDENPFVARAAADALERVKRAVAEAANKKPEEVAKKKEEAATPPPPPPAVETSSPTRRMDWAEVDRVMSPSVLMILRTL